MKEYCKPIVEDVKELSECVYAAGSGENKEEAVKEKCRFGRSEANAGSDKCQGCSATGGQSSDGSGYYEADFVGCPDGMPIK